MFILEIKVFKRHYNGDKRYTVEQIQVSKEQLDNWLKRGNTEDIEIIGYWRA